MPKTNMANQLGELFDGLYDLATNGVSFPSTTANFDGFISAVDSALVSKTWTRTRSEAELWMVPKINLLLSDASIIYGAGGKSISLRIISDVAEGQKYTLPEELYEEIKGKIIHPCFVYYSDQVIRKWVEDASPLISAGRLAYVPDRVLMTLDGEEDGKKKWGTKQLDPSQPFNVLRPTVDPSADNVDVVSRLTQTSPSELLRKVIEVEFPVIEGFSLTDYSKLLNDEHHAVSRLRKAMHQLMEALYQEAEKTDDPQALEKAAFKLRDQAIRPELADLTERYERIVTHRSIRLAGAAVSTICLCASAIFVPAIPAYVALFGTGGAGLAAKEYSDYLKELGELRENPYHFLWELQRKA